MASAVLDRPHFNDPVKAREYLERQRWPDGPICPHCGTIDKNHYELQGAAHRPGLWKCIACRKQFTVTVGTVFERSKIALHIWLRAAYMLCSSKKGISSHQLHRSLGVTYQTAWFMSHRIRAAMSPKPKRKLGGPGRIVEVDETYFGNKKGIKKARVGGAGQKDKRAIVSLVERDGDVRSYHVANVNHHNLKQVMFGQIDTASHLMTDEATRYWNLGKQFAEHSSVNHGKKEYARGNVTTNTVEGYFSILKRGLNGTYQHVSEQHLQRYVNEFDFRYNNRVKLGVNDEMRTDAALRGIGGKRLTYRPIGRA
jgi:transposase-like protein